MKTQHLFEAILRITNHPCLESEMLEIIEAYEKDISVINTDLIFAPSLYPFNDFWELYDKKVGRTKAEKLYNKTTMDERIKMFEHIPLYKESQPDKKFRKDPETYLRNKSWEDEIISREKNNPRNFYNNLIDLNYEYESNQSDSKKFGEV
jgi:hypothetical protein